MNDTDFATQTGREAFARLQVLERLLLDVLGWIDRIGREEREALRGLAIAHEKADPEEARNHHADARLIDHHRRGVLHTTVPIGE